MGSGKKGIATIKRKAGERELSRIAKKAWRTRRKNAKKSKS